MAVPKTTSNTRKDDPTTSELERLLALILAELEKIALNTRP